jgi:hypothetical protein
MNVTLSDFNPLHIFTYSVLKSMYRYHSYTEELCSDEPFQSFQARP